MYLGSLPDYITQIDNSGEPLIGSDGGGAVATGDTSIISGLPFLQSAPANLTPTPGALPAAQFFQQVRATVTTTGTLQQIGNYVQANPVPVALGALIIFALLSTGTSAERRRR